MDVNPWILIDPSNPTVWKVPTQADFYLIPDL